MTEKELKSRIEICHSRGGGYNVTIFYRGKYYSCHSNNTQAYDDMDKQESKRCYTSKQSYQAIWNECKRKNNLR